MARTAYKQVRVTAEESRAMDAWAASQGMTFSDAVRAVALSAAGPVRHRQQRPCPEAVEIARAIGALGDLARNLNQLARRSNAGELVDCLAVVDDLRQRLREAAR